MAQYRGVRPLDLLYGGICLAALGQTRPVSALHLSMVLFAVLVVLADWGESRHINAGLSERKSEYIVAYLCTGGILGIWYFLAIRQPAQLQQYFGLLAGVFFLEAVRDVALLNLSPVKLLRKGYATLVALCLVLAAVADTIEQLQVVLVVLVFLAFAVRKLYVWRDRGLAALRIDPA